MALKDNDYPFAAPTSRSLLQLPLSQDFVERNNIRARCSNYLNVSNELCLLQDS